MTGEPAPVRLEGERVRLRPPRPEDLRTLFDWANDPEVSAPFDRFFPVRWEEFVAEIERAPGEPASLALRYVVERRSDGRLLGAVGYYRSHPVLTLTDLWYLIGEETERGRGFGREAVGLLTDHLFRQLGLERVGATCDVENRPSARLLEALGFTHEGTLRSALHHHARWHDVRLYGVTRTEWAARSVPAGTRPPPAPTPATRPAPG